MALLILSLTTCVPAANPSGDLVVGQSTKTDILNRFGAPAYETARSMSYYDHEMSPPYPAWLLETRQRPRRSMVVFEFDDRGLFVGYHLTGWPSP